MSTKEEIFNYVMDSPENTNPAVLKSMLNSSALRETDVLEFTLEETDRLLRSGPSGIISTIGGVPAGEIIRKIRNGGIMPILKFPYYAYNYGAVNNNIPCYFVGRDAAKPRDNLHYSPDGFFVWSLFTSNIEFNSYGAWCKALTYPPQHNSGVYVYYFYCQAGSGTLIYDRKQL